MRDCLLEVTPLEDHVVLVHGTGTLELGGCLHPVLWQEESHSHLWHKERVGDGVLQSMVPCWTLETLDPVNPVIVH